MNKKLSVQDVDRCVNDKQDSDSGKMLQTAPCFSQTATPKDIELTLVETRKRRAKLYEQRDGTFPPSIVLNDIDTLLSITDQLNNEAWTASRVIAWLDDPNRAPAIHAFTAGNERQIAYRVERLLANPITQDVGGLPSTTVPDQASLSKSSSESESTLVTVDEVSKEQDNE